MSRDSRSIVPSGYLSARVPLRFRPASYSSSIRVLISGISQADDSNNWKHVLTTQDRPLLIVRSRLKGK